MPHINQVKLNVRDKDKETKWQRDKETSRQKDKERKRKRSIIQQFNLMVSIIYFSVVI
jgi:hypothetical protein